MQTHGENLGAEPFPELSESERRERLALKRRIRIARGKASQTAIGRALELTRNAIANWESAKNPALPSTDNLLKLAALTGYNLGWLATGQGVMRAEGQEQTFRPLETSESDTQPESGLDRQTFLPHATLENSRERLSEIVEIDARGRGDTRASEGDMAYEPVASWMLPDGFLKHELHVQADETVMVEIVGDAMMPTLRPGDRVIVDTKDNEPFDDGLYAILRGGTPVVRRLEIAFGTKSDQITVKADNEHHSTRTVLRTDIYVLGRVIARVSKL